MKTETSQRIASAVSRAASQKATVLTVAFMVVGAVSYFGASLQPQSKALTRAPTALYIAPDGGSFAPGSTFSAAIRVASGEEPVNAVQASLKYDPAQLQFVGVSDSGAFPSVAANDTTTPGLLRISRASPMTPVDGDNVVATVTFKMLASSGSVPVDVAFDPAYSFVVRSTDNKNVLVTSSGARYSVHTSAPTITGLDKATGPADGGTVVTITGTNFARGAKVKFGSFPATHIAYVSPTIIKVTAPPVQTGGAVDVVVKNPDGQTATFAGAFRYVGRPSIRSLAPMSGETAGGSKITIAGTNFVPGMSASFGGVQATDVRVISSTRLTAIIPSHAVGPVDIVLNTPDGQQVRKAGVFTYVYPLPLISSIMPAIGYVSGGQQVTIVGSNFSPDAKVLVGGVQAANVNVVSPTTITLTVPARAAGTVSVAVKNADGQTATLARGFVYRAGGDANGDGRINALDLSAILSQDGRANSGADLNGDGIVGAADMAIVLAAWSW